MPSEWFDPRVGEPAPRSGSDQQSPPGRTRIRRILLRHRPSDTLNVFKRVDPKWRMPTGVEADHQTEYAGNRVGMHPSGVAPVHPVNKVDPSGKLTLGVCGNFNIGFILTASYSGCLTRIVDPSNGRGSGMALVSSPAGGFGFDFSASAGIAQDVSDAPALSDLSGPFVFVQLGGDLGLGGDVTVYFSAPATGYRVFVYGVQYGVSAGLGVDTYLGVEDTKVVGLGVLRGIADQIWNVTSAPFAYIASFLINGPSWLNRAEAAYRKHEQTNGTTGASACQAG